MGKMPPPSRMASGFPRKNEGLRAVASPWAKISPRM